jgi:Uncharacterized conserved protein (DUF2039)
MPQPTNHAKKKNNSGRIPAYQNTFAFKHNPKSKKTASILASPIDHCCLRCHDKLVWRKQYRKYKPLTQPTMCNLCGKWNVKAAYHTVCDACSTHHAQAVVLLRQWNHGNDHSSNTTSSTKDETMTTEDAVASNPPPSKGVDPTPSPRYTRVCTVCGKQPALPDASDSAVGSESLDPEKPLKLRQIKTLQRQSATKTSRKMRNSDRNAMESEDGSNGSDEECDYNDNEDMNAEESNEDVRKPAWTVAATIDSDGGVEDPFLAAIGGVQNLLVGEAYQTKQLMEKTK